MSDRHDLTGLELVKRQIGLVPDDSTDDLWLYDAIASVSAMIEAETGRWLAPRRDATIVLDGSRSESFGYRIAVPQGVHAVTYVGKASTDQPDDGSGTYTAITDTPYIRGRIGQLVAGTAIEFSRAVLPIEGYNTIKIVGDFGEPETPTRVSELATIAVVRSFLARREGGSTDIAVTGPNGGTQILRRLSPSELAELRRNYGSSVLRAGSVAL